MHAAQTCGTARRCVLFAPAKPHEAMKVMLQNVPTVLAQLPVKQVIMSQRNLAVIGCGG